MRAGPALACAFPLIVASALVAVAPGAAEEPPPPTLTELVSQPVDALPQGPLCWVVAEHAIPPRGQIPETADHSHGLTLVYQVEGPQSLELTGDPGVTLDPGQAAFLASGTPHAHVNRSSSPSRDVFFILATEARCTNPSPTAPPGVTNFGVSAFLQGLAPDSPYQVQLVEVRYEPGAQGKVQTAAGPVATFVLEGSLAVITEAGITYYQAGDIITYAPDVIFQNTNLGDAPSRQLNARLGRPGEPFLRTVPDVELPSP